MRVADAIQEEACCFGTDSQLTGVYSPARNAHADKPCVVYLTAGLLHHVGPSRLYVEMARSLAEQNVAGFRFDLSGVGDSETSALGGYFAQRSVKEVQQAMDYLTAEYGHRWFVLLGLCSGADDALATTSVDQRVAGIVLLNGYAYRAGLFKLFRYLKFYLPRIFMPEKLLNRSRQWWARYKENTPSVSVEDLQALQELDDDYRYIPPQDETQSLLVELERKRTDMLFVYTGSEHDDYSYKGQLFSMFPALKGSSHVTEHYAQMADHTFILEADRKQLIERVEQWYAQASFDRLQPMPIGMKDERP